MTSIFSKDYVPPSEPPKVSTPEDDYRSLMSHAYLASLPYEQFVQQTKYEISRLHQQRWERSRGRKQTLPLDDSLSIEANAVNNVRNRWVEQGIWSEEWGTLWADDLPFLCPLGLNRFALPRSEGDTNYGTGNWCWGHEEGMATTSPQRAPPVEELDKLPLHIRFSIVKPAAPPNPEACRPRAQILHQVERELAWLRDELEVDKPHGIDTLEEMARENVVDDWVRQAIWRPEWPRSEGPGSTWYHEAVNRFLLLKPPPPPELPLGVLSRPWLKPEGVEKKIWYESYD